MDTKIKKVEILPLIKYYMEALGLSGLFDKYVPNTKGMEIAPAQVLCMMVRCSGAEYGGSAHHGKG